MCRLRQQKHVVVVGRFESGSRELEVHDCTPCSSDHLQSHDVLKAGHVSSKYMTAPHVVQIIYKVMTYMTLYNHLSFDSSVLK